MQHIDSIRMFFRLMEALNAVVYGVFLAAATYWCMRQGKTYRPLASAFICFVDLDGSDGYASHMAYAVTARRKSPNNIIGWFSCDADVVTNNRKTKCSSCWSNDFHHSVPLSLAPTNKKKSSRDTASGERSVKSGFLLIFLFSYVLCVYVKICTKWIEF